MRRLGHVPALDGIRGIAVLLVVLTHLTYLADPFGDVLFHVPVLDHWAWGAFLGVDIFFVLSGFLITALLLGEHTGSGRIRLASFYQRRALRLLPALVCLLAVHFVYASYVHLPTHRELTTSASALGYVFNFVLLWHPKAIVGDLSQLWSLSIEEHFYLVWPTVLVLLLRRRPRVLPTVLGVAIVVVSWHRMDVWQHSADYLNAYLRTDTRIDSLLVGALLAWAWVSGRTPTRWLNSAAWIAASGLFVAIEFTRADSAWLYYGGYTVVAVAVAVVILAAVERDWGHRTLTWTPLRGVGRVSYGLYLWHFPVFAAIVRYGHPTEEWERIALALALSALATWLSWSLVERRALAFRPARAAASALGNPPGTGPNAV